jgi:hypothetical protein
VRLGSSQCHSRQLTARAVGFIVVYSVVAPRIGFSKEL